MQADAGDGALADILAAPTLGIGAAATALVASACVAGILVGRRARGEPLVQPGVAEPVAWDGMDVTWVVVVAVLLQSLAAAMGPDAPSLDRQLVSGMLATGAAALIAAWHLRRRGASWPVLGFRVAEWPTAIAQAVGAVALVVAPLLATAACLDRIVPYRHPLVEFLGTHRDAASIALVWLAATVTAPIVEEFFFRRILQGWLEKWLADRVRPPDAARLAIAGSAVLFALAHLGHGLAWVPLLGLGGVLGYLARQTGSIVPGILAHAMFNAVSVILVLALQPAAAG